MQILIMLYRSALPYERVAELFHQRSAKYAVLDGLLDKLYVHEPATGHVGGIYLFDTEEHLARFRGSDLERSIGDVYQFVEPPTIHVLDVMEQLHAGAPRAAGAGADPFRDVVERGFNRGELDALDALFTADFTDHQDGIAPANLDGLKRFITAARTAFPDLRLTIETTVTMGDTTWSRTTARGTHRGPFMGHPPTGRAFTITRFDTCRLAGGKIAEHWGVIDRLALLRQLGVALAA